MQFHRNYAESHRARGDERAAAALETRADIEEGHARMAERGEWVLNEKGLLARAGLDTSVRVPNPPTTPVPHDAG